MFMFTYLAYLAFLLISLDNMLKFVFIGDIVGKIGRKGLAEILPKIKKKYKPDLVIANAENIAHGKGVTVDTLNEALKAGVDFFTSGNHVWSNKNEIETVFSEKKIPLIRPANYPPGASGDGYKIIEIGVYKVLIVNLIGRVFFKENFDCPFRALENILAENKHQKFAAILVDFHAEATSEKNTLPRYFDGQVSAVIGTHTHVQTADEQILPNGTAFISDAGMVGAKNSSLGIDLKNVVKNFLTQTPQTHEVPEAGTCHVDGIFVIIKPENGQAQKIERLRYEIEI